MDAQEFIHTLPEDTALIIVDMQHDFLYPRGALAVPGADEQLVHDIAAVLPRYRHVAFTQDFHPRGHLSFASSHKGASVGDVIEVCGIAQRLWPNHCVQGTRGAEIHPELLRALERSVSSRCFVVQKGTDVQYDSYSAFFDNARAHQTSLDAQLKEFGMRALHVCGLATDYCVKSTVLDAVELGYETTLLRHLCRAVNVKPGDDTSAISAMRNAGCLVL